MGNKGLDSEETAMQNTARIQQYKTDSLAVWFKEKTGLRSTFETGNLQKWKYLFSSSIK